MGEKGAKEKERAMPRFIRHRASKSQSKTAILPAKEKKIKGFIKRGRTKKKQKKNETNEKKLSLFISEHRHDLLLEGRSSFGVDSSCLA